MLLSIGLRWEEEGIAKSCFLPYRHDGLTEDVSSSQCTVILQGKSYSFIGLHFRISFIAQEGVKVYQQINTCEKLNYGVSELQ